MYQFRIIVSFFVLLLWFGLFQTSAAHAANGLTLMWQNNATNADGIIIQRRPDPASDTTFTEIRRVMPYVDQYVDKTVEVGKKYCYHVGAYNAAGVKYSNVACGSISPSPGDLNSDGKVDCSDLSIVKASYGKLSGQPGFDPRADTNKNGIVNIIDLSYVAHYLPAGTSCP